MDEAYEIIAEAEGESKDFITAAAELSLWSNGGITYADVMRMTPLEMRIVTERLSNKIKTLAKMQTPGQTMPLG